MRAAMIVRGCSRRVISTLTAKQISLIWYFKNWPRGLTLAILWGTEMVPSKRKVWLSFPDNIEDLGIVPGDFNSDGLLDFIMLPAAGGIQVYTQK